MSRQSEPVQIYAYALRIDEMTQKEKVLERMKQVLKDDYNVKTTVQTHWLTTVVKFIVRTADRQTASNYSKVLQTAFAEDIAANELAAYIDKRGGIMQARETEAETAEKAKGREQADERLNQFRKVYESAAYISNASFKFDGGVSRYGRKAGDDGSKDGAEETGSFCIFLTVYDDVADEYRIVQANDFGKTYENAILRHMLAYVGSDTETMRKAAEKHAAANREWLRKQHEQVKAT